eukprot:TRINITY_DN13428_c0_g1_i1.p1 TRINITY_DN13428_c0_g1~~TRINITY_DN13428_c0_g1_i1.p1  ORF type:complete len:172 (+),score=87.96 TRINITY_DN13428_c0_g1_i1:57-572(+)
MGDVDVFFVSQKAFEALKGKLEKGDEIKVEELAVFAFPGDVADEEMLVPLDLSVVDDEFGDEEEEVVDEMFRLDVRRLCAKLGAKGTAQALVKAFKAYEASKPNLPADDVMKPMTAKEWKEIMEDDDSFADFDDEEDPEEELLQEEEEEEEVDPEEEAEDAEPKAKKAKTA